MAVRISRRSFLIGSAATMAGSVAAYSYWYEPARTVLERITITLERLPAGFDGVTIAQVTDVHHSAYVSLEHIRQAVQVLKAEAPDLVVLTGDFVSLPEGSRSAVYAEPCARALADLHGSVGSFAVLGNHDHHVAPDRVTGALQAAGFTVLLNEARPIERHGHRLWICGTDDALVRRADFARATEAVAAGEPAILLAHEPDVADAAAKHSFLLQLAGHSHGGQVRLPLVGAPVLPRLGRKYPAGLYRIGAMQLYTSRGLGLIAPAVRLNCPPEITLITLRSPQA
jgi:predicted MPP superfamily phosphohydrolase